MTLAAGSYTVEWYSVDSRTTAAAAGVTVGISTASSFGAPFEAAGPAVLYLKRTGS